MRHTPAVYQHHFYPRSPRGERRLRHGGQQDDWRISIHAPREGSDAVKIAGVWLIDSISIHAPREGSDFVMQVYN